MKHNPITLAVTKNGKTIGFSTTEEFKNNIVGFYLSKNSYNKINGVEQENQPGLQLSLF